MRRYTQWLEGAFIKLACELPGVSKPVLEAQTVGIMKLHALFGTELIISDVQLIDSPIILSLFTDESFQNFISNNQRYLQLVAHPGTSTSTDAFSLATRGLQRALNPKWTSSTFPDPIATRQIASTVLEAGQIDVEKELKDEKSTFNQIVVRWPDRKKLLEGMIRGVAHFSAPGQAISFVSPYQGEPMNLYKILRLTLEKEELANKQREQLKNTIKFIEDNIEDEKEREMQSIIFTTLDRVFPSREHNYYLLKHTTHHAWNAAVETTLDPDGGSLGHLVEGSVQVGEYLAKPTDALVPVSQGKRGFSIISFRRHIPCLFMDWDPTRLSWDEIGRLAEDTRTTAQQFQNSIVSGNMDKIHAASTRHIKELTRRLISKPVPIVPHWAWLLGHVLAIIIGRVVQPLGMTIEPPAHEILVASHASEEAVRHMYYFGKRHIATDTLKKIERQMLPRK